MKKFIITLLALSLVCTGVFAGGGSQSSGPAPTQANTLSVCVGPEPATIDPALNSAVDGFIMVSHLFEGLYKYADSGVVATPGQNVAVPRPGQVTGAPRKTVNADGTITLVYTLRSNLKWSDGSALTANDYVYSWRRLVDPETAADYCYIIDMVKNAIEIQAGKLPTSALGIRAVNNTTLEITLTGECAYFDYILAFAATMPVKESVIRSAGDQWTFSPATYVSNGPYKLREWVHNSYILVEKNPNYYSAIKGPQYIRFVLMDDTNAILANLRSGQLDYAQNFPLDEVPAMLASREAYVQDYIGTYFVSFNTQKPPFDNPQVRRAFTLVIDRNFIVNNITRSGQVPAGGFVPFGMPDVASGSDFRRTRGDYYSVKPEDYQRNIAEAQQILAAAGYPGGRGFPVVEYMYNTSTNHRTIAEALQNMWQTALGVRVTLSQQDWSVFLETRKQGEYQIARDGWIADYPDGLNFLDMFIQGSGNNNSQYRNNAYDSLIDTAKRSADPAVRIRALHDAEDMMLGRDWIVAPIYFYTQVYGYHPERYDKAIYSSLGIVLFTDSVIK
jgi:oligopeptide transport system substrate-binding protein